MSFRAPRPFILGALLGVLLGASPAAAVDVTLMGGWQYGGKASAARGTIQFESSPNARGILGFEIEDQLQLEISYTRQFSRLEFRSIDVNTPDDEVDASLEYFHGGVTYDFIDDKLSPFLGVSLGATHVNPDRQGADSETRFSMNLLGGGKLELSDRFGARVQATLMGTYLNSTGGMFCGGGGGCYANVSGQTMLQGDFSAGLIIYF